MKLFSTVLFVAFIVSAVAAPSERQKLRTTSRSVDEIRELIEAAGGCNANVCFALDGSGSVTERQFGNQKDFVIDVMSATAGNAIEAAAVQYGLFNRPISFLTADIPSFLLDVDDAQFAGASRTSVGSGIVWCARQLRRRPGEANKIVVLGDGRNNLGGSPRRRANLFRQTGGKVCVVGIGFDPASQVLLNIAGGDPNLVLRVRNYLELADILEDLVQQVCEIEFN